ncbi:MAG TPA: hypothetical protein DCM07_30035 [Planctomycetaceae bacterium]|nr:hypothetical protein [Gimesia sp.]HAH49005.1 hypothetical protein [Planctomycetaceae bacterium]HBL43944.1 hypothetical protein [Planctomycetaceae bacterium]|tara:strand:+ start:14889 stop:15170 length:282 start_codon:yes stop_codon:yes gene_type:complete
MMSQSEQKILNYYQIAVFAFQKQISTRLNKPESLIAHGASCALIDQKQISRRISITRIDSGSEKNRKTRQATALQEILPLRNAGRTLFLTDPV